MTTHSADEIEDWRERASWTSFVDSERHTGPLLVLQHELERFRLRADRSDPLDETVLCLLESAAVTVEAAERGRCGASAERRAAARSALAAARAAVVAAGYAVAAEDRSGQR